MKMLIGVLTLFISSSAIAEVHPDVQAALDWQLPANTCEVPESLYGQSTVDKDGVSSTTRKLNPGQERLYKKKKKKYDKCVETYKQELVEQFGGLRDVAQHGLTQPQADAILVHLKMIQAVVENPMGLPPEDVLAAQ